MGTIETTIRRAQMVKALKAAKLATNERSPVPLLQNVKLSFRADGCYLAATDSVLSVTGHIEAVDAPSEPFTALVPPTWLAGFVDSLDDELLSVAFDPAAKSVAFYTLNSEAVHTLAGDPDAFPVPVDYDGEQIAITGNDLKTACEMIGPQAAQENTRWAMASYRFEAKRGESEVRITCGNHTGMAIASVPTIEPVPVDVTALLDPKFVKLILSVCQREPVRIGFPKDASMVQIGSTWIYSPQVIGRYPDIESAKRLDLARSEFKVLAGRLQNSLRSTAPSLGTETNAVRLDVSDNQLSVSVPCDRPIVSRIPLSYGGERLSVGLPHRLLSSILAKVDFGYEIAVAIPSGHGPTMITLPNVTLFMMQFRDEPKQETKQNEGAK